MEPIIDPIPIEAIKAELSHNTYLRDTNKGHNQIYIVNNQNAPNTIQEIGRLRELAFRQSGGGTGLSLDIDSHDTDPNGYQQLIVWSPEDQAIIGGYRFIKCIDALDSQNHYHLSTNHYFEFSNRFCTHYLPKTIELGRSFIQPDYQNKDGNRKGLFSLDNLWDGLGALIVLNPDVKYFFGKVTLYQKFNQIARDAIIAFMHHYFPDNDGLVKAKALLKKEITHDITQFVAQLHNLSYKDGHSLLNQFVRDNNEHIPPLVNSYMNLSSTMRTFDSAVNPDFGDVEETAILIYMDDIYPTKKDRHINTFDPTKMHHPNI